MNGTVAKNTVKPQIKLGSMLPLRSSIPLQDIPIASVDEQLGETFTQNMQELSYNVTANAQTDYYGYGPAYLVNGLTDTGYWYQVGLSYDWPYADGGYINGFVLNYEVFAPGDSSVFPTDGGGGAVSFSGSVDPGDIVSLTLTFAHGEVGMYGFDWNTSAYAQESYDAEGSTTFVGLAGVANSDGYFTGLMTEWYHTSLYLQNEGEEIYTDPHLALQSAFVWADEFSDVQLVFVYVAPETSFAEPNTFQEFSSNGLTAFSDAYEFITGFPDVVSTSITLNPVGASTPFSAVNKLMITYQLGGSNTTTYYTGTPLMLGADRGTHVWLSPTSTGSSTREKWVFSLGSSAERSVAAGGTLVLNYYDLVLLNASYTVVGGGQPVTAVLTYDTATSTDSGSLNKTSVTLGSAARAVWAVKGSPLSVPQDLGGSSSTERWFTAMTDGIAASPGRLTYTYQHQFWLSLNGPNLNSEWVNASSTINISMPDTYDRSSGTGLRLTSYSVDGGGPIVFTPTDGSVSITLLMDTAHSVQVNSTHQYLVTLLDPSSDIIASITPPTIPGDSYWYDQGTTVKVVLLGAMDRSLGAGVRLTSYSVDGEVTRVAQVGLVQAAFIGAIASPHTITWTTVEQYELVLGNGQVVSVTPPTVDGDAGWYDQGTKVTVVYQYAWNSAAAGTRTVALGYLVNGILTSLPRAGNGTFDVAIEMTSPNSVTVSGVTQYSLTVVGGQGTSLSVLSPTQDSYFDVGTRVTVSTQYTWGTAAANNDSRESLVSWTLGTTSSNVSRSSGGQFITPEIVMDGPEILTFQYVHQYLVNFRFMDSEGVTTLSPTLVQLKLGNGSIVGLPPGGLWLDRGTLVDLYSIRWENSDLTPIGQSEYVSTGPLDPSVPLTVYNTRVTATDLFGLPVAGAKVSLKLTNGTTVYSQTGNNGTAFFRDIPAGNYLASVSFLGGSVSSSNNAATNPELQSRLLLSVPVIAVSVILIAVVVSVIGLLALRRRHIAGEAPTTQGADNRVELSKS